MHGVIRLVSGRQATAVSDVHVHGLAETGEALQILLRIASILLKQTTTNQTSRYTATCLE